MNCTASVTADRVELWLPSQFPESARRAAAQLTSVPLEKVEAHVTFMGGGFGRRAYQDFVVEAVQLSQRAGAPVKVVWTREDDIQHDLYRPAQLQRFRASLDVNGRPIVLQNRIVGPSTEAWWNPATTTPRRPSIASGRTARPRILPMPGSSKRRTSCLSSPTRAWSR